MIRVITCQPTYTTHEAHDWQLAEGGCPERARQCARCGVIRVRFSFRGEEIIRYSKRGANIRHCNAWRAEEPTCMTEDTQP